MTGQHDDPEELAFTDRPVPLGQRMGRMPLTMAWWSVCSAMFYLVIAASLALAYGARNAIIGLVLSVIAFGVINMVLSRHSMQTGMSVSLFSRILLGNRGAAIATLIFFATAAYYAIFEGSVMALALSDYAGWSYPLAALLVVVYSVALIFGSIQNWLDRLNGVLLPFFLAGLLSAVVLAIVNHGYSNAWLDLGPATGPVPGGWWDCFTAYMGVWILMMYTYDYARFGRPEDRDHHARFTFGMPFYAVAFLLNGLVGIFLAANLPGQGAVSEVSVVIALIELMGLAGLAFVWISQTRINTANYYLATVNLEAFAHTTLHVRLPKWVWACVVGALVYVLMMADVFAYILQALAYQGIFVVAWVAIALVHVMAEGRAAPDPDRAAHAVARAPAVNRAGLGAWLLASAVGLVLHFMGGTMASISAPATFVVGCLAYGLPTGRTARQPGS